MAGANAAYDLSLFERTYSYNEKNRTAARKRTASSGRSSATRGLSEAELEEERKRAERAKKEKAAHDRKVHIIAYTVLGIAAFAAISLMAVCGGRLHNYNKEINIKTDSLHDLDNEYESLRIEYEYILGTSAIEDYAINSIGMQKVQPSQVYWVTVNRGDIFEISDTGSKLFGIKAYAPFGIRV